MNAAAAAVQVRQRGLGAVHLAEQVHLQHAGELLGGCVVEPGDEQDPGHLHPGVEPAVGLHGAVGDGLDLGGVGDVGDDRRGRAARLLDLVHQRAQPGLAAGGDHDRGALLGEPQRGGAADAARGAHHDDDLFGDGFQRYVLERHGKTSLRRENAGDRGWCRAGCHAGSRSAVTDPNGRPLVQLPRRWTGGRAAGWRRGCRTGGRGPRRTAARTALLGSSPGSGASARRRPGRRCPGRARRGSRSGRARSGRRRGSPTTASASSRPPRRTPPAGCGPRSRSTATASSAARRAAPNAPWSCGRPLVSAGAGRAGPAGWWPSARPGAAARPRCSDPEGEIATTERARPRTASSRATRAPMELPSTCTRSTPSSSRSVVIASVMAAIVGRRASAGERPCPGRSGASTRNRASSRGRTATKSSWVLPMPCSSRRGSPDPAQSQES